MLCSSCNFENPQGLKFCGNCGSPLLASCPNCSFQNPPEFKFCGQCGSALSPRAELPAHTGSAQAIAESDGERRQLTVMFCDLVDSTALASRIDPEDLRGIITTFQTICSKIIIRYEGHVAQYMGDGIMVYFGYPTTYENSANQAVSSGLGILEAIQRYNLELEKSSKIRIAVRIGIHTGPVVMSGIGADGQKQQLALGAAPNIASRLQSLAKPDTLVISEATYQLVYRCFSFDPLGPFTVKGILKPIELYRVIRENTARSRFEARREDRIKFPIIGREKEIKQLTKAWKKSKLGKSHFVCLSGEAGMGKSRVLQELMAHVAAETDAWLINLQCSPYHKTTAYYPFMHGFKHLALKLRGMESPEEQLERLEGYLLQNGLPVEETLPLFANHLAIPLDKSRYQAAPFSAEQQIVKLNNALITIFLNRASEQHLLLILEDLHWIDPYSLDVVSQLIQQAPALTFLCVLSFRPEFSPPWRHHPNTQHYTLSSLSAEASRQLINSLAGNKKLPDGLVDQLIQKTDGVPLFVEELTKTVLHSELMKEHERHFELTEPLASLKIPSTLHDSLIARLDRMSQAKSIAQIGSTLGREFPYSLLAAVSGSKETSLNSCLRQLVEADLLNQTGQFPDATFRFRHALICDAAYESLLKTQRQAYHKRIAKVLLTRFPEMAQLWPERVAYHYEQAGALFKAASFYLKAAIKVKQHLNYKEALSYIEKGLKLVQALPKNALSTDLEISLLSLQIPILVMVKGWSSPASFEASDRLCRLAEKVSDLPNLCQGLNGLTTYYIWSGYPYKAASHAKRALKIAEEINHTEILLEAYRLTGQASVYTGKLKKSLEYFNKAISLYQQVASKGVAIKSTEHPLIFNNIHSCHILWCLGFPDQACDRARKALALANSLNQPYSQAVCHFIHAILMFLTGKNYESIQHARQSLAIAEKFGLQQFSNEVKTYLGCALVKEGKVTEGRQHIYDSLKWRQEHNLITGMHIHLYPQACMHFLTREYTKGLQAIDRVLVLTNTYADQYGISETYRLKGELLYAKYKHARANEAQQFLARSLQLAQKQQALSFELRSAISLSKIWIDQGQPEKAQLLLTRLYNRFTEGFSTADLKAARHLIETVIPHTISSN